MSESINQDFTQYVYRRCEAATNDPAYIELEGNKNSDPDEILCRAQELCYMQGFKDAMSILTK